MKSIYTSSRQKRTIKKSVIKNFAIFTGKHVYRSLFLIQLQTPRPAIILKETPTQLFSWKHWVIFEEHLRTTVSVKITRLNK